MGPREVRLGSLERELCGAATVDLMTKTAAKQSVYGADTPGKGMPRTRQDRARG